MEQKIVQGSHHRRWIFGKQFTRGSYALTGLRSGGHNLLSAWHSGRRRDSMPQYLVWLLGRWELQTLVYGTWKAEVGSVEVGGRVTLEIGIARTAQRGKMRIGRTCLKL